MTGVQTCALPISATVTSYGPLNRHEKMLLLLHRLTQGQDIALVSDNGTPIIYDPGSLFVAAAHQAGIPVKAIPGPSTLTAATAISGFSGDAIIFEGHLPSTKHHLAQYLSQLRKEQKTLVFYVRPRALRATENSRSDSPHTTNCHCNESHNGSRNSRAREAR